MRTIALTTTYARPTLTAEAVVDSLDEVTPALVRQLA
jgi:hypothetical protein